ncbi:hypothetical protein N752_05605 [Desulforamulus aquiferis]|nr:hypothetical protein N752_05605 [Desulforamulus aquiferis]
MACAATRRDKVVVARTVHPEYREVLSTYMYGPGIEVNEISFQEGITKTSELEILVDKGTAAVLVQYPNFLVILKI